MGEPGPLVSRGSLKAYMLSEPTYSAPSTTVGDDSTKAPVLYDQSFAPVAALVDLVADLALADRIADQGAAVLVVVDEEDGDRLVVAGDQELLAGLGGPLQTLRMKWLV